MGTSKFKYQKLKTYIIELIRTCALDVNQAIESEPVLVTKFNLSRNTVRQALQELENEGYVYRVHGKGTFVKSCSPAVSKKIALILFNSSYTMHPVTERMIRGIDSALQEKGYTLDILAGKRGNDEENINRLAEQYAGILIGAYQIDELTVNGIRRKRIPHLFIKNYRPDQREEALIIDFERGGYLAAEHLAQLGHRELALFFGGDDIQIAADFKHGVIKACLKYGLKLPQENIFVSGFGVAPDVLKSAEELLGRQRCPTGIITMDDLLAVEIIMLAQQKDLAVPGDISIIGCNDGDLARLFAPSLTTVRIPTFELGQQAAASLIDIVNNGNLPQRTEALEPELIIRNSSGEWKDLSKTEYGHK